MGEGGGAVKRLVGLFIFHPFFFFLLIVIFDIYFVFYKEVYLRLSREGKCIAD